MIPEGVEFDVRDRNWKFLLGEYCNCSKGISRQLLSYYGCDVCVGVYNRGSVIDCAAMLITRLERGRMRFHQFLHVLEMTIFVEESNQLRY